MQQSSFVVFVDRSRKDSFVMVSQAYLDTTLLPMFGKPLPPCIPLRVVREDGSTVYVGCLTQAPHRQSKLQMNFPFALATDMGLRDGQSVTCVPLKAVPRTTKVLVSPLTVDDSEVVEQNAMRIEHQLLRQVQVVSPGMIITVSVFPGVQAKVKVQSVETSEGRELQNGCATMFEGTHFVVATRARREEAPASETETAAPPPRWGILRALPTPASLRESESVTAAKGTAAASPSAVYVSATTAHRLHWTSKTVVSVLDVARLTRLQEAKITPTFLREEQTQARIVVVADSEADIPAWQCWTALASQATNLLLTPVDGVVVEGADVAPANLTASAAALAAPSSATTTTTTIASHAVEGADAMVTFAKACEVHQGAPKDLLAHLRYVFGQPNDADVSQGNVLLYGGKGYGKSTVVSAVLSELPELHHVQLECTTDKSFLPALHKALAECVLCAPSVLVLDNFDEVAPEQAEGNVAAMSAATKASLESAVTAFSHVFSVAARSSVVVIATSAARETVNQAFRTAFCFQRFIGIEALTRTTRQALLAQCFPEKAPGAVRRLCALMDNYTPFDVRCVAARVRNAQVSGDEDGDELVKIGERCVKHFTPLAHTGISFLKGEKVSWSSVGGLADAKKALYDTLVLPMKHPQLFARLPLKTRSGILLYGPSGCGKTFVIESLVNAEDVSCIVVNGPEVFGKYIGQSEQKIRDVFERAQAAAPCVIFFDEFDSVAPQRGVDNSGVTDRVVNQLLCYLDGVEGRKDVYVVAASSRPDLIDAALLRPGRLDKAVECPIPSRADRTAILSSLLAKTTADVSEDDVAGIVEQTENWTPADLSAIVSTANTYVNQRIMESLQRDASTPAGASASGDGAATDKLYWIGRVGPKSTREKVADSLRILEQQQLLLHGGATAKAQYTEKLTNEDLVRAMHSTRPSLSEKDMKNHERIQRLFKKGEAPVPVKPGTKLTFS